MIYITKIGTCVFLIVLYKNMQKKKKLYRNNKGQV